MVGILKVCPKIIFCIGLKHGLRTPNVAFFHRNPELLGLGGQIGHINFEAFWVILAKVSCSIHFGKVSPCFLSFSQYFYKKLSLDIHIPNIYLGLGFKFGPQRSRNLAFVCP